MKFSDDFFDTIDEQIHSNENIKKMRLQAFEIFKENVYFADESIQSIFENAYNAGFIAAIFVAAAKEEKS